MAVRTTGEARVRGAMRARNLRRSEVLALIFSGVFVTFAVAMGLRSRGIAATHTEQMLDCHYAGNGAHTHDTSCCDADGNLVCPLSEREYHVHDDSCYTETRELICELGEHTHTEDCYDETGNLVCGLEEHTHADTCYQVTRKLSCKKEEVTETHQHGPGCFREVTVTDATQSGDEAQAAQFGQQASATDVAIGDETVDLPAQSLTGEVKERDEEGNEHVILTIDAKVPKGALPAETQLLVSALKDDELVKATELIEEAVLAKEQTSRDISSMQLVNIAFVDAQGDAVRPQKKVELKISGDCIRKIEEPVLARTLDAETKMLFGRAEDAEVLPNVVLTNSSDEDESTGNEDTLAFKTKVTGTYAILEVAHEDEQAAEDAVADEPVQAQNFSAEVEGVLVNVEAPAGAFESTVKMKVTPVETDEVKAQVEDAIDFEDEQIDDLAAVDISFITNEGDVVEPTEPVSVSLTSEVVSAAEHPVLVQVNDEPSIVESAETVNSYSETMVGGEDTLRFEGQGVGTYALVSLQAIRARVIAASGETYEITVTYGPEAGIPDGAELRVREILADERAYAKNVKATNETLLAQGAPEVVNPAQFDISIVANGVEVEPAEGSVVNVEVKLVPEAFEDERDAATEPEGEIWFAGVNYMAEGAGADETGVAAEHCTVAHITADGEAELIDAASSIDENNRIVLEFETESFSDYLFDTTDTNSFSNLPSTIYVGDEIYMWDQADYWVTNIGTVVSETKHTNGWRPNNWTNPDSSNFKTVTALQPGKFRIVHRNDWNGGNPNRNYKEITVLPAREGTTPPATIETIDNATIGLKLNLFDYDLDDYLDDYYNGSSHYDATCIADFAGHGINAGHALKFWGSGIGDNYGSANQYQEHGVSSIVQTNLAGGVGGYPQLTRNSNTSNSTESLEYLFSPSDGTDKKAYTNVNGLFKKVGDYYVYDSNENYAYYNPSQGNGGSFEVYDGTYNQKSRNDGGEQASSTTNKKIGFFPFHKWDEDYDLYVNWNKNLNHHFGMSMSVDFNMPKDPKAVKDTSGNDIIFEFSGDDDLWVFIDGKLAMDIGGIHQPTSGTINFTTGVVTVNGSQQLSRTNFNDRFPNLYDGNNHTLQVFYIERGGCDSNCKIQFNLTRYGHVEFDKADKDNPSGLLAGAVFGIYKDSACTEPLMEQLKNNTSRAYIAESNASGHVVFSDIPLGTYYLKELHAPEGYPLDPTIHEVRVYLDQETGQIKVSVTIDGVNVEDGVKILNKKPAPITLGLKKEWHNADDQTITAPAGVASTFEIKRIRTYETYTEQTIEGQGRPVSHLTVGWIHNEETHVYKEYDLVAGSTATVSWGYVNGYEGDKGCVLNGTHIDKDYVEGNVVSHGITMPAAGQSATFYIIDDSETGEAIRTINVAGQEFFGNEGGGIIHTFTTVTEPDTNFSYTTDPSHVTNNQVTLPIASHTWQYAFTDLPTFGTGTVDGVDHRVAFNYSYYLEEVSSTAPAGTTVTYKDLAGHVVNAPTDVEASVSGTETIVNKVPFGYLQIEKKVTYSNQTPTEAQMSQVAGTYTFKVYTTQQCAEGDAVKGEDGTSDLEISITVDANGAATVSSGPVKLLVGDYWIKEVSSTNPVMFPTDNSIAVPVTKDDTASQPVIRSLTNNYDSNNGPDKIALDIEKVFAGLDATSQVPADFQVVLQYKVGTETKTVTLHNQLATGENGEKIKYTVDGYTWHWEVTNIPSDATDFKIREENYDHARGYDWTSATLNGNDITETIEDWHSLVVTAPEATLSEVTNDRRTSDSHSNTEFYLEDGDILLSKLTAHQGTLVVSKHPLNLAERDAVKNGLPNQFDEKLIFYSIEEHPNGFGYSNKTVTFGEKNGRTTVKFDQASSAQESVFAVTYHSEESRNNANLSNVYEEVPVTIDIVKVDENDNETKLPGAVFTIRQIADVAPDQNGTLETQQGTTPRDSSPTAETTGLTSFSGLTHGYYEVVEKTAPDGYVLTDEATFYFKIDSGAVTWLERGDGKPSTWVEMTSADGKVSFDEAHAAVVADPEHQVEAQAAQNATFTVENEPGAELPSAGGPGAWGLMMVGVAMILSAATVLVRRRA